MEYLMMLVRSIKHEQCSNTTSKGNKAAYSPSFGTRILEFINSEMRVPHFLLFLHAIQANEQPPLYDQRVRKEI